ncbi:MAG: biotin transporter BioY [Caldilineales bacterium]|nr:biotin transporter BioY [Caldilineales bacterium]MCW5859092.1 biotin transporter BioY [Caldilineales bacterium]
MSTQTLASSRWTVRAALIIGFALFTGLAAQVRIPLPFTPVPITLQVLAVILAGLLLGPMDGFLSQLTYLGLIALGAPLAAGWIGGPTAFVGPTAGYLVSFPMAAAIVGWLAENRATRGRSLAAGLAGVAVIYLVGATWLALTLDVSAVRAFQLGVAPFIVVDVVKGLVAVLVGRSGATLLNNLLPRS